MKKQKTLVIDFAGSSCSGKTFVKNAVFGHLSREFRCLDISNARISAGDWMSFFLFAPAAFLSSLSFMLLSVPSSPKAVRLFKKLLTVQVKIRKARLLDCDFAVLDEGLFKWLTNARGYSLRKIPFNEIPYSIKKRFLYPDMTVLLEADFDTVQVRKEMRGLHPEEKNSMSVNRFIKYRNRRLQDLLAAEKSGFIKVLEYDNIGEVDAYLPDKILNFLGK